MAITASSQPSEIAALAVTDRHPAAVYLGRLAPGSRRTMREALDGIAGILGGPTSNARDFDWSRLRYQHAQVVRSTLAERYAVATTNKMLAALRGVMREAWRLGLIDGEDYTRIADIESVRGQTLPRGRALSSGELSALLDTCVADPTPAGARDAALISLLYGGGLRRSEAVGLDLTDYDPDTGSITIRRGKGMKDRVAYATNGGKAALDDWLAVRGDAAGPLLLPVNKGGRVSTHAMSGQAVLTILRKRARQAAVAAFSPHDLRRTYIGDLLDAGADISTVQRLAGHAQVTTTARYDRRGEVTKRRAAELLHVPYRSRVVETRGPSPNP